jgi:hypothetical protein
MPIGDVDSLEQALRTTSERTGEVLIELSESLAGSLSISGHELGVCAPDPSIPNPVLLCGSVDLVGATTGELTIELDASRCAEPVQDVCD